jgi:anti-sigma factor RsiW
VIRFRRHPVSEEELSAQLDGRLPAVRAANVTAHLEACSSCRGAMAELESVRRLVAALPAAVPPRSFAIREADLAPAGAAPRLAGLAFAPAVAIALFVALLVYDLSTAPGGGESTFAGAVETTQASKALDSAAAAPPAVTPAARSAAAEAPSPVAAAAQPPATPAAVDAPPEGPSLRPAPVATGDEEGRTWLRALQIAAAAGFVGSLAYLLWKRRRTPSA